MAFQLPHECLAGAALYVDLTAIVENYRILTNRLNGVLSAAVVKADGYGLGAKKVGKALLKTGCKDFFVAHVEEGITLRSALPSAKIHILNGLLPSALQIYQENSLIPVLGSLGDIEIWRTFTLDSQLPCDIHVDTGMLRLGLPPKELSIIKDEPGRLNGLNVRYVMSHLISAEDEKSKLNFKQLSEFKKIRTYISMGQASIANSSGIFLGSEYHLDVTRPGAALYGINPTPDQRNPMLPTVTLLGRIIQIRDGKPGDTVGYNATHRINKNKKIATVSVGYADGYLRSLSNNASGMIDGVSVPLVGRVSMDLVTFDVTEIPERKRQPGQFVELIGKNKPVDLIAHSAGTIGYEILTNLGNRYNRMYLGDPE